MLFSVVLHQGSPGNRLEEEENGYSNAIPMGTMMVPPLEHQLDGDKTQGFRDSRSLCHSE